MRAYAVRDATVEDAPELAHVDVLTWQAAYEHVFPTNRLAGLVEEHRAERWRDLLAAPPDRVRTILVEEETVLGFAHFGPARDPDASPDEVGELYAVYVLPQHWGLGVGRSLIDETLAVFRREGYREAILWTIEENPRARSYYERTGWYLDGGTKVETVLDIPVRQLRYRIALA